MSRVWEREEVLAEREGMVRDAMKTWSCLAVLLVLTLAGCGEGAKLLQEKEDGGIVAYPFTGEQGAMLSAFRTDALALMKEKCGGPYTIVREGGNEGAIPHHQLGTGRTGGCRRAPVGHPIPL